MISIVTDSLCDIPPELNEDGKIKIVPLTISFGDKVYTDLVDFTHEEFFEILAKSDVMPKTSHPSADAFLDVFKKEVDLGNSVICVCASPNISGTINAARNAKEMLGYGKIDIINSLSLSMGEGLVALLVADMAKKGFEHDEIVERAKLHATNNEGLVLIDTVEYLHKGGRVSTTKAIISSKLRIKPILDVSPEGQLEMVAKALGMKKGIKWITQAAGKLRSDFTNTTVAIGYSVKRELAEEISRRMKELYKMGNIILYKAGSAIGSHTGPGAAAIFFEA